MKKYTRIFILMLLLAALLALSAWADGTTVSVSDAQVDAGGTVTVQLSLENNPGVAAVSITLDYDASKLRPVSFDVTREASSKFMLSLANEDAGTVMMVAMKDVTYSGVIAELEFEALSDAAGEAAIGFADVQLCNFNDEIVSCGSDGGVVQIANDNAPAGDESTDSDTQESDTSTATESEEAASATSDNGSKRTDPAAETESGDDSAWVQESIARFEQEQAALAAETGIVTSAAEPDAAPEEGENATAETAETEAKAETSKPAAKRSTGIIIVVVLAVVVLAAGVIAMLRMRKKDKTARH